MPTALNYGWEQYLMLVEELCRKIRDSGHPIDQVIAIPKGGNYPADIVARVFDVPIAYLPAERYDPKSHKERGRTVFQRQLASTAPGMGLDCWVIDDLDDKGLTLEQTVAWLRSRFPDVNFKVAVLWHKTCSCITPDLWVKTIEAGEDGEWPWIVQPFERYESMTPEDLGASESSE
ncbi:MAG: phosphoribosyltransferase family protein [bacterium]